MADGKWISDLSAITPLVDAARHVLRVRLDAVGDHLPLVLEEADKDPEHVHQLRVSTRRAGAALDMFAQCLPEKVYRTARRLLRRLRRAAGAARDWDVFLLGLPALDEAPATERPGVALLVGVAVANRAFAQEHLNQAITDYPFAFEEAVAETVAAVQKPRTPPVLHTLQELARPWLSGLLQQLDETASGDLDDYEHLHQVRIVGKRLRYAMEVFADCFVSAFREKLYPQVEAMQEILGRANDSHVAAQRLTELRSRVRAARPDEWKSCQRGVEKILRCHQQRLPRERHRFLEWWRQWQASGAEAALGQLLRQTQTAAS